MRFGPKADDMFGKRSSLDRIARAEDVAEVAYEQNKIAAAEMLSERVALNASVQTPICDPGQVPMWLPASRSSLARQVAAYGCRRAFARQIGRNGGDRTA
jgi:hypothetical protein